MIRAVQFVLELFLRILVQESAQLDVGKELIDLSLNFLTRNWAKNSSSPCQYLTDLIFLLKNSLKNCSKQLSGSEHLY